MLGLALLQRHSQAAWLGLALLQRQTETKRETVTEGATESDR